MILSGSSIEYILQLKGSGKGSISMVFYNYKVSKSLFRDVKKGIVHLFSARLKS